MAILRVLIMLMIIPHRRASLLVAFIRLKQAVYDRFVQTLMNLTWNICLSKPHIKKQKKFEDMSPKMLPEAHFVFVIQDIHEFP